MMKKSSTTKKTTKASRFAKKPKKPSTIGNAESSTSVADEANAFNSLNDAETAVSNIFFYTNDKFFASLDNDEVISAIVARYPDFAVTNTDAVIKNALVEMLNDQEFMSCLLKHYCISVHDLVKMMNKNYGMLFKGTFLKKVRTLLLAYGS